MALRREGFAQPGLSSPFAKGHGPFLLRLTPGLRKSQFCCGSQVKRVLWPGGRKTQWHTMKNRVKSKDKRVERRVVGGVWRAERSVAQDDDVNMVKIAKATDESASAVVVYGMVSTRRRLPATS